MEVHSVHTFKPIEYNLQSYHKAWYNITSILHHDQV